MATSERNPSPEPPQSDLAPREPGALRPHTSIILGQLVADFRGRDVSIGGLLAALRSRAYGLLILIVALTSLVPGLSVIGGIVIILFAGQLAIGREVPRLPGIVARRRVRVALLARTVRRILPTLRFVERFVRPRYAAATGPGARGIAGIFLAGLGIALLIPFPFSQVAPALAAAVVSIGLLERDGVVFALGILLSVGALLISAWMTALAWRTFVGMLA